MIFNFDNSALNALGTGFDMLSGETKQPIFILESVKRDEKANDNETYKYTTLHSNNLPEGVVMKNYAKTEFSNHTEVFSENQQIDDTTEIKLSGSGSYYGITASFSASVKTIKQFISRKNHVVTRVKSSNKLNKYTLILDGLKMTKGFSNRIEKINVLLQKDTEVAKKQAIILADELLNMFGTHIIHEIVTGGIISKVDAIDKSFLENFSELDISVSASASFGCFFSLKGSYTSQHKEIEDFEKAITSSNIITEGGDPWKDGWTFNDWIETIKNNPAIISKSAVYIVDIVDSQNFPEIDLYDLYQIKNLLNKRFVQYMINNLYTGCGDPKGNNYVSYANVFDKNLCNYEHNFHFGGIFTISDHPDYVVPNVINQKTECPEGFEEHPLLNLQFRKEPKCKLCFRCLWTRKCCCDIFKAIIINTETKICLSNQNRTTGLHFGGVYTDTINNEYTGARTCPYAFYSVPIYHNIEKTLQTHICVAPYDSPTLAIVPFGGIFSSQFPNYLVGGKTVCGDGFERHPVGGDPIAELTYCTKIGALNEGKMKNIIPPGRGANSVNFEDIFELVKLDNQSFIGLHVDPRDKRSYIQQVVDYANFLELNVSENERKMMFIPEDGEEKSNYEYLQEFMLERNFYSPLALKSVQKIRRMQSFQLTEVVSDFVSDITAKNGLYLIIGVSILVLFICIFILLISIIIKLAKVAKKKKNEYEAIK